MRWPFPDWLRGKAGREDSSPGPADRAPDGARGAPGETRGAPGPDPGPIPGPDRDVGRVAWRELPPVQRAVGAAPLTAPSAEFARGLSGRRAPDPMLAPLGHDVTADGPAGLVSGIAVPLVQRAAMNADLARNADPPSSAAVALAARGRLRPTTQRGLTTTAPLPRSAAVTDQPGLAAPKPPTEGAVSAVATGPAVAADPTAAAEITVGAEVTAAAGLAVADPAPALPDLALRSLPVARLATGMPAIAATRVADTSAPAPVVALAPAVRQGGSAGESAARTGTSGSPGAAAVVSRATGAVPAAPPGAPAAPPPTPVADGDPGHPVPTRRTLGESRRLGLGAPLTERPPLAGREAGRSDLPVARLHRSTDAATTTSARPPIANAVPAAAAESLPLPRLVVARRSPTTQPATVQRATVQAAAASQEASTSAGGPLEKGLPATPARLVGEPAGQLAGDQAGPTMAELAADVARPLVGDVPIGVSRLVRDDAAVTDAAATTDTEGAAEPGAPSLPLAAAFRTLPAVPGPAIDPTPGSPGADVRGTPATADPGAPRALSALQRTVVPAVRGGLPSAQGAAIAGRPMPPVVPLVAARPLLVGPPIVPANAGSGSRVDPAPVVARIAIPGPGSGGSVDATGAAPFGTTARPLVPSESTRASMRDERPVVARSALATGRGPSTAPGSALPVARSAVGVTERVAAGSDEAVSGRSGGVVSWAAGTGFTTVAPAPGPFVQRAVAIDEMTVTPGGEPAGTAGQGAGQSGAGGAGTDYEELAEQLYDKIRARLTTELLLDRERAGLLVDG